MASVVAFVQARMRSKRLPGKVLRQIAGHTILEHVLRRVSRAQGVTDIVVLTSVETADDPIVDLSRSSGYRVARGPEDDVLARFAGAARSTGADAIVRLTADSPLVPPSVISDCVLAHRAEGADLTSTRIMLGERIVRRVAPAGMSVDVLNRNALERADRLATSPFAREHVIPVFFDAAHGFHLHVPDLGIPDGHLQHHFTVDTEDDLRAAAPLLASLEEDASIDDIVAARSRLRVPP